MKSRLQSLNRTMLAVVAVLTWSTVMAQNVITVSDNGSGTGTNTWTSNNTYLLDGFVFVNQGQTLTIEPGTVIKGAPGTGEDASALIVARGATIMAAGTAEEPIIFTYEDDNLDGLTDPFIRGQWGGVIILGNARLNSSPGVTQIEGIPSSEPRGEYGGDDDDDSSGIFSYVSIRHGGSSIGANNEINGLTLGAVGRNTQLDHIEVLANQDDGVEFFGGTPRLKYAAMIFCGDDAFDYDEGFRGKGQYWFTIHDPDDSDNGGEHDGGTDPEDGQPYAKPTIYNATYIGNGTTSQLLKFRDNAGGFYWNSIFANFATAVTVENLASGEDSYSRFENDDLALAGNLFYDVVENGTDANPADVFEISMGSGGWNSDADSTDIFNNSSSAFQASFDENDNMIGSPGECFAYNHIESGSEDLYPVPNDNTTAPTTAPGDGFFDPVDYRGAFDPAQGATWLSGWTAVDSYGFLGSACSSGREEVTVNRQSLKVYPNPSHGTVNIRIEKNMRNATLRIYDITGQQVAIKSGKNMQAGSVQTFDLNGAEPGIYLVNLQHGKNLETATIIKR